MQKFIMLVGISGSGKSTYSKLYTDISMEFKIHSSDALRAELYGNESIKGNNNELFSELHKRIISDLTNGKSVIYDACNLSCKRRMAFLQSIKKIDCYKECVVIATPYEQCLVNNCKRERKVPEDVIKRMYMSFCFPAYFEGWNNISIHYYNSLITGYKIKDLNILNTYDQHNPNHTLTLGGHMKKCGDYVSSQINSRKELDLAAYLHDIGKPFCQTYQNTKGETTEKAHYYCHENVGAYLAMFYLYNENCINSEIVEICTLIQNHMKPYFFEFEKTRKRYNDLFGDRLYNDIMLINKGDRVAH